MAPSNTRIKAGSSAITSSKLFNGVDSECSSAWIQKLANVVVGGDRIPRIDLSVLERTLFESMGLLPYYFRLLYYLPFFKIWSNYPIAIFLFILILNLFFVLIFPLEVPLWIIHIMESLLLFHGCYLHRLLKINWTLNNIY